jgi:regulator of ribosome biosynthesis
LKAKSLARGNLWDELEKFAKSKGIQKKKREKMVWDEATQQWAPRWGYGRANNAKDAPENWVVEAKPGDDGSVDPFEERADARKQKKQKQKRQEERNRLEAAHAASVGQPAAAKGLGGQPRSDKKAYLKQAIAAAQVSTASVGRFDKALPNEPSKTAGKRKKYESATGKDVAERDAKRTAAASCARLRRFLWYSFIYSRIYSAFFSLAISFLFFATSSVVGVTIKSVITSNIV